MKKIIFSAVLILSSFTVAFAQDARAKNVLDQVSKKYRSYTTIKASFTVDAKNQQANINDSQSGTLYAQPKSNKFKIILEGQELLSDGKTQWTYLKEYEEVQVSQPSGADVLNPARIFTIYEKGYKYLYEGKSTSNGRSFYTIDLTPTDSKSSIYKIRLKIDKLTKMINSALIFDKNGNRYTYTIKSYTPNVKVSDSFFTFDAKKHPGVEIVDLR